ncbi:MAG: phosphomannomutase/phosphoglucomutase [Sphaerochaeta sp.]
MGIFKANDIRGIWNDEWNEETAYKIGFFLPQVMHCDTILVGRDIRLSSDKVFESLSRGIVDAGCDVLDIGLATTPMVYFATVHFGVSLSVQITASHNPAPYNGMKVSKQGAIPVCYADGLDRVKTHVENVKVVLSGKKGVVRHVDALTPYLAFQAKDMPDFSNLKLAIDCSNGMACLVAKELFGEEHCYINDHFDGSFPAHEPNPLDETTCAQIKETVLRCKADLGIIFDGDADRVMFIDEKGTYIHADHMGAILGHHFEKGIAVVDIRSSRSTVSYLETLGFEVVVWKVGHAQVKQKMRELGATFGGELSGHYYFKDFFYCDSAVFATKCILEVLSDFKDQGKSVSQVLSTVIRYKTTGEVNYKLENKEEVMDNLLAAYSMQGYSKILTFDGYRIEFPTWWFSVRISNTEPYLRLVMESTTQQELDERFAEISAIIEA